jgi:hypothetical protein
LKAATNLNFVQPKLFQTSRQDDLRLSDCTVSIQILDDADVAFRISGAELRTVLSATTMLADRPHRLNVFSRSCLRLPHSRLGYPRSGLSRSDLARSFTMIIESTDGIEQADDPFVKTELRALASEIADNIEDI